MAGRASSLRPSEGPYFRRGPVRDRAVGLRAWAGAAVCTRCKGPAPPARGTVVRRLGLHPVQGSSTACTGCKQRSSDSWLEPRSCAACKGRLVGRRRTSSLARGLHYVHETGVDGPRSGSDRRTCAPGASHPGSERLRLTRAVTDPRSHENDRTSARVHPSSEELQRPPTIGREAGAKRRGAGSDELSRSTGPRQHEDDPVDRAIAKLEIQPSHQGLAVVWTRLGFDAVPPFGPDGDHRVPGPLVAWSGERHLGGPAQPGMKQTAEPIEEADLGGVADRLRSGIHPSGQLQPDHRCEARQMMDRRRLQEAALDTAHFRRRKRDCSSDLGEGQSTVDPSRADLLSESSPDASSSLGAEVGGSLPRRHSGDAAVFRLSVSHLQAGDRRPWTDHSGIGGPTTSSPYSGATWFQRGISTSIGWPSRPGSRCAVAGRPTSS